MSIDDIWQNSDDWITYRVNQCTVNRLGTIMMETLIKFQCKKLQWLNSENYSKKSDSDVRSTPYQSLKCEVVLDMSEICIVYRIHKSIL